MNEEDVLEWKEEEPELEKSTISNGSISGGDTVEKVIIDCLLFCITPRLIIYGGNAMSLSTIDTYTTIIIS